MTSNQLQAEKCLERSLPYRMSEKLLRAKKKCNLRKNNENKNKKTTKTFGLGGITGAGGSDG